MMNVILWVGPIDTIIGLIIMAGGLFMAGGPHQREV